MSEIILFHHGQGLTDGVLGFADALRGAGHTVHTPDLYDGHVFATLDEGMAYRDEIGIPGLVERATAAVAELPTEVVYAGFSLGTAPAQLLTQTRPGAVGTVLVGGALPAEQFGAWPSGVPLLVVATEHDSFVDLDVARALVADADGELEVYSGSAHLFADPAAPDYDADLAARLEERVLAFLG